MNTHFSWERGVIIEEAAAMIAAELGVFPTQKTAKTKCGKRVAIKNIDNMMPTCADCRWEVVMFATDSLNEFQRIKAGIYGPVEDMETVDMAIAQARKDIERYG